MRRVLRFLALAVSALVPSVARADISYSYVTDQTSYSVSAPGNVTVSLYLQETLSGGASSLIAYDGGLASVGVSVDRLTGASIVSTTGSSQGAQYGSTVGGTGGPASNVTPYGWHRVGADSNTSNPGAQTATHAQIYLQSSTGIGAPSGVNPDASGRILIGSFVVSATSGSTTFSVQKYPPPTIGNVSATAGQSPESQTSFNNGGNGYFDLDFVKSSDPNSDPVVPSQFGNVLGTTYMNPYQFTVTVSAAVPEPSSMLLCGFAVFTGAYSIYRKRRDSRAKILGLLA